MAPPSHLFVVRHGNRYDVVDKEWHRTSPTPYDPPLSYGGWIQSKHLGARIAAILASTTTKTSSTTTTATTAAATAPRRRYNVVVHSSPFLRCVQTSIAIAAGICQSTATVPSPAAAAAQPDKVLLRLDPFLGEWLSPDYFEGILSPPSSNLLLASAKAELLRPVSHQSMSSQAAVSKHRHKPSSNGAALWTSAAALDSVPPPHGDARDGTSTPPPQTPPAGYAAPTPNYAVSLSCQIPDGFVAHARDACVVSDYQWDSSRAPLDWGDGGALPEEWQAMHKRLKKGLQSLVDWYAANERGHAPVTVTEGGGSQDPRQDEEAAETVVVVVSHGAGCNAMIGALTNKPVLIDVNVASLTWAQRKAGPEGASPEPGIPTALDQEYALSLLANIDHYRPTSSSGTPPSGSAWNAAVPFRSRVTSMSTYMRPAIIRPFTYSNIADSPGQKTEQTPRFDIPRRRQSHIDATLITAAKLATTQEPEYTPKANAAPPAAANPASQFAVPRSGLWAPPSRNTLLDIEDDDDDLENMLPDFENKRLSGSSSAASTATSNGQNSLASSPVSKTRSILMPPIELLAALGPDNEEAIIDLPLAAPPPPRAGLWESSPRTEAKRRWTVNERSG
jgi:broad specificity phosphatase PhoE